MKFVPVISILCCGMVLLSACKKDEQNSPTAQKLQAGKWQISASTLTFGYMGKDTTVDFYSSWRPCEQDDMRVFDKNGKGYSDENTNKCPEDNQVDKFTWELLDKDTKLKSVLSDKRTIIEDILEISDTALKLKSQDSVSSGPAIRIEKYRNVK